MFPFPGGGEEDDDMDFVPSSSSKLASLFGLERPAESGGNASLTYTAPKQPGTLRRKKGHESGDESGGKGGSGASEKKGYQQSHQNSPKLDLISAKPVTTYKLEKEGYTSKGMLGVAIQGSHRLGIYHLILYDREKLRVTDVKIVSSFQFTVQANNYATFYDEDLQNWSLMFFSSEAAVDFAREVGLARANVSIRGQTSKRTSKDKDDDEAIPNRNSAMVQDLKNKGGGLRRIDTVGDLVDVRYFARVLDDAVLHGEVVDSNEKDDHPLCLKVTEWWKTWKEEETNVDMGEGGDKRWWEGALWGATVGTRKMIVLPPEVVSRMKGLKIKLSPEACLVYEVEIIQIRRGIGNEEVKPGQTAGEACKPGRSIMANTRGGPAPDQEGTPRKGHVAGCSMSSAVTSTPSGSPPTGSNMKDTRTPADKASILSRMARMGQPTLMLPDLQARRRAASEGDDGAGKTPARGEERNAVNEEEAHADEEVDLEDGGYILPMEVEPMPISSGSRPPPPRLQPRPIGVPQVQQPYQSSVYWHSPPQYSNVPSASSYSLPSRPESTLLGHPQQHQQYPYPSHTLALTGPAGMTNQPTFQDPHLSVFLSETRTQNAELRMAMGRLTDKVDAIMGKLDRSPQQQQPQEQYSGDLRAAFEKDRTEWKDKEEKFEKEMAEAKSKLTSRVVAVEERCKTLEKENTSLKKELEEMSTKLTTMQSNRSSEISEAVKSAMNSVYSHLQPEFSNGVAYEGLVVRKTLAATIREVTLNFLSSNTEEKEEPDQPKGGTPKEVHTLRRKAHKPEIKAKPDGRKVLLRKGSSPKIDVDAGSSGAQETDKNGASGYKESSKHTDDEGPHLETKSSGRDSSHTRMKDESRSRSSSREGSLERVINPEPPSPPIFDAGELSESGEEWFP
ncbi:FK506-binding protein 15-like isoform X2 [Ischnura elegans]|uniref:FK506-binding protein 15-like isoform X2 n=1 Tax=Ischnura elegans TaxID=197161 RepID=UPI001ED8949D|nr:FK506-binding protein 15-like isoform X2 [Ischnura elegans]